NGRAALTPPIPATVPHPARSASTTASSCATNRSSAAGPASPPPRTFGRRTGTSFRRTRDGSSAGYDWRRTVDFFFGRARAGARASLRVELDQFHPRPSPFSRRTRIIARRQGGGDKIDQAPPLTFPFPLPLPF